MDKIKKILEEPFWPQELKTDVTYFRTHDDCDGDLSQGLQVTFSSDGDAWVTTDRALLRYRMPLIGGGRSPRVRNALLILAMAIRLDNEENQITYFLHVSPNSRAT